MSDSEIDDPRLAELRRALLAKAQAEYELALARIRLAEVKESV